MAELGVLMRFKGRKGGGSLIPRDNAIKLLIARGGGRNGHGLNCLDQCFFI